MGRRLKQRELLKANRMVSTGEAKKLFGLPSNNAKPSKPILTIGRVFSLLGSPNVLALIPSSKRSENWVSFVPFTSSKSSEYFGFVFYSNDFSRCFVLAFAKSSHKPHPNDGDFASMFGYTYKEIEEVVTMHISRVAAGEIEA